MKSYGSIPVVEKRRSSLSTRRTAGGVLAVALSVAAISLVLQPNVRTVLTSTSTSVSKSVHIMYTRVAANHRFLRTHSLALAVQPDDPPHLETIKNTIDALLAKGSDAENNYFSGNPKNFSDDPLNPYVHASCSSFVVLALKDTYPWMDDEWFSTWTQSPRPNSAQMHDAIETQPVFEKIVEVTDIEAGDLLIIKYLDGQSSNTGHAMVAASAPTEITTPDADTVQPDTVQYSVEVVDESSSYHTKDDTRFLNPGKYGPEGLGWGYFRIYAHLNGTVAGYSWSTSKYSSFYAPAARDLVIGRLNTTAPAPEAAVAVGGHVGVARALIDELEQGGGDNTCDVPDGQDVGISWSAPAAAYGTCGSSFVTALLKHSYGWSDATFSSWWGSTRPSSSRWSDKIEAGEYFTRITQVADIQPGDLLVYTCVACSSSHSMIASSTPQPIPNPAPESLVADTTQFSVDVVDGCSSKHGSSDTRNDSPGGIGEGTIRMYANGDGTIAGYSWSTYKSSTIYLQADRPMVAGRLTCQDLSANCP